MTHAFLADLLLTDLEHHRTLNDFLHSEIVQVALTLICLVIIQLIARDLIGRVIHRSIRQQRYTTPGEAEKRATTVTKVCQTAAGGLIWIVGLIFILGLLHVNIAALATGAGLISVIIGLGAQNTLKDFLSGIFIILENQYGVGDIITAHTASGDVSGKVEDLSIRITKMRDLDGTLHILTNGSALIISNVTARYSVVKLTIHLDYDADISKVKGIVNDIGNDMIKEEAWSKQIIEPIQYWRIDSFDDYAIAALMIGKVKPGTQYDVAGEFRERLLKAFKAAKVDIPTAQVVVGKTRK